MRSKTDLARYLEEEGITDLNADDFDFTVRGKHQSVGQPSKRKRAESHQGEAKKRKGSLPKVATTVKETRGKKSFTAKEGRKKSSRRGSMNKESVVARERYDSPKKGKTITQRLVIKMAFTSGESQHKSNKKESKTLRSVKAKVKRKSEKDRQDVSKVECEVNVVHRDKSDMERKEDCYVTPKKNPRFREAVEEEDLAETKAHGANIFDMFDKNGHIVTSDDVKPNVDVNCAQSENEFVKLESGDNNSSVSNDAKSLTRLKRRGSGNIDYAKLSGKNKRVSTERKISSRKPEYGNVKQTAVKESVDKPTNNIDSCDEENNSTETAIKKESDVDSVCGNAESCNDYSSQKDKNENSSERQLESSQECSSSRESPDVQIPDVQIQDPELVEADDNSLDIGKTHLLFYIYRIILYGYNASNVGQAVKQSECIYASMN